MTSLQGDQKLNAGQMLRLFGTKWKMSTMVKGRLKLNELKNANLQKPSKQVNTIRIKISM